MVEGCKLLQRLRSRVDWDIVGIGIYDETVVDIRLLLAQFELSVGFNTRKILNWSLWNKVHVNHKIFVGGQGNLGSSD